jgi:hypothetical protein
MSLVEIHARLASTALLFSALMALWGFWRFFRKQGVGSSYWGAAVVAVILLLAQGALGMILWFAGAVDQRPGYVHWLYGAALALALPLVYSYTKGRQERPEMLLYAVAFLIMIGLVLRAMVTGGG